MIGQWRFEVKPDKPQEFGYFLVNAAARVSAKVTRPDIPLETTISANPLQNHKPALENKIGLKIAEDVKLSFKSKFEQKKLDEIVLALTSPSGDRAKNLAKAFGKTLGMELSYQDEVGPLDTEVGGGVEISATPFIFFSKWKFNESIEIAGTAHKFEAVAEGRVYIGLSKRGWAEVVRRVGPYAIRQYLARAGGHLARLSVWLVGEGVLVTAFAGGVVGTFGLVALAAYATGQARRSGALSGIEAWYVSAYARKLFGEEPPRGVISTRTIPNAAELTRRAITVGQKDAVADARRTADRRFHDPDFAIASDTEILIRHRARLINTYEGSRANARHYLEQDLRRKVRARLGIR